MDVRAVIDLCGKPLLEWVLEALRAAHGIGRLCVVADPKLLAPVAGAHGARLVAEGADEVDNLFRGIREATSVLQVAFTDRAAQIAHIIRRAVAAVWLLGQQLIALLDERLDLRLRLLRAPQAVGLLAERNHDLPFGRRGYAIRSLPSGLGRLLGRLTQISPIRETERIGRVVAVPELGARHLGNHDGPLGHALRDTAMSLLSEAVAEMEGNLCRWQEPRRLASHGKVCPWVPTNPLPFHAQPTHLAHSQA